MDNLINGRIILNECWYYSSWWWHYIFWKTPLTRSTTKNGQVSRKLQISQILENKKSTKGNWVSVSFQRNFISTWSSVWSRKHNFLSISGCQPKWCQIVTNFKTKNLLEETVILNDSYKCFCETNHLFLVEAFPKVWVFIWNPSNSKAHLHAILSFMRKPRLWRSPQTPSYPHYTDI